MKYKKMIMQFSYQVLHHYFTYTGIPERYCEFSSRQPQQSEYWNKVSHTYILVSKWK